MNELPKYKLYDIPKKEGEDVDGKYFWNFAPIFSLNGRRSRFKRNWGIEILEGDLKGILYKYKHIMYDHKEPEEPLLSFETYIFENPNNVDTSSVESRVIFSNILYDGLIRGSSELIEQIEEIEDDSEV